MHHSLRILEILELVFSNLTVRISDGDTPDQHHLAVLARTCKHFQDPALNVLWSEQSTLFNLLDCFPADLFEVKQEPEEDTPDLDDEAEENITWITDLHLRRPVTDTDWERPRFYSNRVRTLFLRGADVLASGQALLALFAGDHIFPNLVGLSFHADVPVYLRPSFNYIHTLLSPRIEWIDLDCKADLGLLSRIVPILTAQGPYLTRLSISGTVAYSESELRIFSTFVRSLVRVADLAVENLDHRTFQYLGRLPTLRVLNLENPRVPRMLHTPIDDSASHEMYSSLETLQFGRTTLDRITAFVDMMSNSPLETIVAESLQEEPTGDAVRQFYSALAANCSLHSLQTISIIVPESYLDDDDSDEYRINGATLRIIFRFVNITHVFLEQPFGFDLDDTDIFDMACSWPRIEWLALRGTRRLIPRASLQGLYAFAQHCPNLRGLKISVDATGVPERHPTNIMVTHSRLTGLELSSAPIRTPSTVAAFISAIFPRAAVYGYWDVADDLDSSAEEAQYYDLWQEVADILSRQRSSSTTL
ncbi:hypothetical protein DFH09DRAFT_1274464 [Mycena vulgaris]|nr:hypothetical protein DFH09DRAFT_1274464 [Mycena vulgaris]